MPLFVQGKQLNLQGKKEKHEGTLKETKFPHKRFDLLQTIPALSILV